jgi:hypothetical protein
MKIDCSGALTIVLCLWVIFGISKSVLLPTLTVSNSDVPSEMNANEQQQQQQSDDASSTSDVEAVDDKKRTVPLFRFVGTEVSSSVAFFHVERVADGRKLSFADVLGSLSASDSLSIMEPLLHLMHAQASLRRAFFFECAPISAESLALTPFQCAFVTSDALLRIDEDRATFAEHFPRPASAAVRVVAFDNLSGDATLVVPTPAEGANHAHLASFSLSAPRDTQATLWQRTADELLERVRLRGARPVWLSTSGLGVSYLHVRICDQPKYYTQKALTKFTPPPVADD